MLARKFTIAIVVQSFGPASLFFAVWFIARELGSEMQGKFSAVKSLVEFLAVLLTLGLPQSFVYGINQLGVQRGQIVRWTLRYGVISFGIACFLLLFLRQLSWASLDILHGDFVNIFFFALAVAGFVTYALLRGIFLTLTDGWLFSLLTVQPALLLSAAVIVFVELSYFDPVLVYSFSGLISAVISILLLRRYRFGVSNALLPWNNLLANGSAVFLQNLFIAAQPFVTLAVIRQFGGSYNDIAFFSLSMYVYQGGVVPLTMVAPILFNRWTNNHSMIDRAGEIKGLLKGLVPIAFIVGIGWFLVPLIIPNLFGITYKGAVPTIQVMLLAIPFLYVGLIGMPALMSLGMFRTNVAMAFVRLLVSILSLLFLLSYIEVDYALAAAQAWLLAEFVLASLTIVLLKSKYSGFSSLA